MNTSRISQHTFLLVLWGCCIGAMGHNPFEALPAASFCSALAYKKNRVLQHSASQSPISATERSPGHGPTYTEQVPPMLGMIRRIRCEAQQKRAEQELREHEQAQEIAQYIQERAFDSIVMVHTRGSGEHLPSDYAVFRTLGVDEKYVELSPVKGGRRFLSETVFHTLFDTLRGLPFGVLKKVYPLITGDTKGFSCKVPLAQINSLHKVLDRMEDTYRRRRQFLGKRKRSNQESDTVDRRAADQVIGDISPGIVRFHRSRNVTVEKLNFEWVYAMLDANITMIYSGNPQTFPSDQYVKSLLLPEKRWIELPWNASASTIAARAFVPEETYKTISQFGIVPSVVVDRLYPDLHDQNTEGAQFRAPSSDLCDEFLLQEHEQQ